MIDGTKIFYKISDFTNWKLETGLSFEVPTNVDTGEMRGRRHTKNPNDITYTHTANFETYRLTVLETDRANSFKSYNLIIEGSLHKNYFKGENYQRFTFHDLQIEIAHLCKLLQLEPGKCKIQNLEIGVNLETPFNVSEYINNSVLLHSTEEFCKYKPDETGFILGRVACHSQHSIKCYDKGAQYSLKKPLMRFEDRCIKMQYLFKFGIKTLKDLTDLSKVSKLENLLLKAWENVLISEPDINPSNIKLLAKQKSLVKEGQYRGFWSKLHTANKTKFNKQRTKFRELMSIHSSLKTFDLIKDLIQKEWAELLKTGTNLPSVKYPRKNIERNKFTIKVKSKNVPLSETSPNRVCLSCGKDISNQNPKSKYCSAKYVGEKQAHKCRNDITNPINNFTRQIDLIKARGQTLFDIHPFLKNDVQNHVYIKKNNY